MKKYAKKVVWSVVAVVFGYVFVRYVLIGPVIVPEDFKTAREKGVLIAEDIAFLSNKSIESLGEISKYDTEKNYSEALILVSRELIKNKELNQKALYLSTELGKMAESIPEMRPGGARELASEAISYEVASVSRLLSYSNSLKDLFELLRTKFMGTLQGTDGKVQDYLNNINASAISINALNKNFNETLKKFDEKYSS